MNTLILYDLRSKKRSGILALVTGLLAVLMIIILVVADSAASEVTAAGRIFIYAFVVCIYTCPPMCLYFTYHFIYASVYLSRLKKSGYEVPVNKKEYKGLLDNLPHTGEKVTNRYASDSRLSGIIMMIAYAVIISADIWYNRRWADYETDSNAMTVFLVIIQTAVCGAAFIFFIRQGNTDKYIDNLDIKDGRKTRAFIVSSCLLIIILTAAGFISVTLADSMTKYIYKSRYGYYEKTLYDLYEGATLELTSNRLTEGLTDEAPDLSFEAVDGAEYYVIYMVDMDDSQRVLWYAEVTSTSLEEGNDAGSYTAPVPHAAVGPHECVLFVFAMAGEPDSEYEVTAGDTNSSPVNFYYSTLNTKKNGDIPVYGNVISYGYIRGYA